MYKSVETKKIILWFSSQPTLMIILNKYVVEVSLAKKKLKKT